MDVTFPEYMLNIQRDFVAFVAAESVAFRSLGTNKRDQRVRMVEMVLMKGAYAALEAYDYTETDPMWTQDEVDAFVEIINGIIGTSYEVAWGMEFGEMMTIAESGMTTLTLTFGLTQIRKKYDEKNLVSFNRWYDVAGCNGSGII